MSVRDTILYALGLGYGSDPLDEDELRFVYEENIRVLPTMAVVLGYPGFWLKNEDTGVDWKKALHGEQGLIIHKPLTAAGTVVGRTRVTNIIDKGAGKGALLFSQRDVIDRANGDLLCILTSTSVLRGDGGFGGPTGPAPEPHPLPQRSPDSVVDLPTLPQAALIYCLSGDYNPLHADPKVAVAAGSSGRFCTGCAPSASPDAPSWGAAVATIRTGSIACRPASRRLFFPEKSSALSFGAPATRCRFAPARSIATSSFSTTAVPSSRPDVLPLERQLCFCPEPVELAGRRRHC